MLLGVIPARGGSKTIPRKNLHPLNGKPLIDYTMRSLGCSRHDAIDRVRALHSTLTDVPAIDWSGVLS